MNQNPSMPVRCETGRKRKLKLWLCAALIVAGLGAALACLSFAAGRQSRFIPPPFEPAAVQGVPAPPSELGYTALTPQEGFSVALCGAPRQSGDSLELYLTNCPQSRVWVRLAAFDSRGDFMGETGILTPGQYVRLLKLSAPITPGEGLLTLKIMAFEPESYVSCGAVSLNARPQESVDKK